MLKRLLALVTLAAVMAACGPATSPTQTEPGGGLENPAQTELPMESPIY